MRTRSSDGCLRPLDYSSRLDSNLDASAFECALGSDWPDQELLLFVRDGVQFKAKLSPQIFLLPHLMSFSLGAASVERKLQRLAGLNWFAAAPAARPIAISAAKPAALYAHPPADVPSKMLVAKPTAATLHHPAPPSTAAADAATIQLTPNTEAAAEHAAKPVTKTASIPANQPVAAEPTAALAAAQSAAAGAAKQIKPSVLDKVADDAKLRQAARLLGEPVFSFTDDARDNFNRFTLAAAELWKVNLLWTPRDGSPEITAVISELRLGFGLSVSSNHAQRFSQAWLCVVGKRFDEEELPRFETLLANPLTPQDTRDWIEHHKQLVLTISRPQLRLFSAHIYTDDPAFTVAGADRLLRLLRVLREVVEEFGILMAIPQKRQLGQSVAWLGIDFHVAMRVAAIPAAKVLRA
ncbi:hypothetical protein T492DRAFT_1113640 [Pavlovales sp. CCMP2436]|nr:hypothetical protein T492DRAFT_1113640 [Pavlovales sp. CCMP2436]